MSAKKLSKFFNRLEDFSFINELPKSSRDALLASIDVWESAHFSSGTPHQVDIVRRLTDRMGLTIEDEALNKVARDWEFELWTKEGKLIGSSNGFYSLSSFSIQELFKKERAELFEREEKYTHQLLAAIGNSLAGAVQDDPVETHLVTERKINPVQVEVRIKLIAPIRDVQSEIVGVVAFLKLRKM